MSLPKYIFYYDIFEKKTIIECTRTPTSILQQEEHWLWARNNKYDNDDDDDELDLDKSGKWMVFVPSKSINAVWNKIKEAIKQGHLYSSKVSTYDPFNKKHAIMIYTKDYRDLDDVIKVLDYLEASGIKLKNSVIKYKTDNQTRAGIYSGGSQKPWIYASDTIRSLAAEIVEKNGSAS